MRFSPHPATLKFIIEYLKPPVSKILLQPTILIDQKQIPVEEAKAFFLRKARDAPSKCLLSFPCPYDKAPPEKS